MPRPRADKPTYSLATRAKAGTGTIRYYVQWWEDGAARRVSCRTGELAQARRFLAEFEAGRGTPPPPDSPTIGTILDGYKADRERRPASPTLGYNVARLAEVLGDLPAEALTKERIRHYLSARREKGAGGAPAKHRKAPKPIADSTLRRELLTLRAALMWAQREGWIEAIPHIEAPGQGKARDRWLTRAEAATLLASAKQLHVRVFMALALYTAGRAGALLELKWNQVDFASGVINLGDSQGNKRRARVPLHPALRPVLLEAQEARTSDFVIEHGGLQVGSIKVGFRNATIRAKLPGVTPHVLRHTAATWMAQQGVPLMKIAAYLGNSAVTVENVYAHHTPDHMAEASAALNEVS